MLGRLNLTMSFGGKTEFLQHFGIDLEIIWLWAVEKAHFNGEILIGHICHLIIFRRIRNFSMPETAIFDIGIKLRRIG